MTELEQAIEHAIQEIERLRRDNELMDAQLGVLNVFQQLISPRTPQGYRIDPVWQLLQAMTPKDVADQ